MKHILPLLLLCTSAGMAQSPLVPGKKSVEKKWITNRQYQMTWYALKDTARIELGTVTTEIKTGKGQLTMITQVSMKNSKAPWIDSSVASLNDLSPLYHSSYNGQRDMVLQFGKPVTGYYLDKTRKKNTVISDTVTQLYFDSNLYPYLLGLLPLKEGYTQEINIYDYNPSGKIGVIKARVKDVQSGAYLSANAGTREVWVVTVQDEIGSGPVESTSIYYFDKTDRKLWKQDIILGARKMLMLLKE